MNSTHAMRKIAELDFQQIKAKLMHAPSGEGWTRQRADAVETEYRRFLCMMHLYPLEAFSPLVDVDTFWHYHILDTRKYAADCAHTFGYFLHHHPYVGIGEDDAEDHAAYGERMQALYFDTFGEPCGAGMQAAWCSPSVSSGAPAAQVQSAAGCSLANESLSSAWCSVTAAKAGPTAWCSVAAQKSAETAWCSVAARQAGATAWCSVAAVKPAGTAWCSVAAKPGATAWCSVAAADRLAAPLVELALAA